MKLRLILPLLALGLTAQGAEKKKAAEPKLETEPTPGRLSLAPGKADNLSSYKTADDAWKHLQELLEQPKTRPTSREEMITMATKWFGDQHAAAEDFVARFPKDPRRYNAQLISLQSGLQLARVPGAATGKLPAPEEVKKQLADIIAAPDAPEDAKGEATFVRTIALSGEVDPAKPETVAAFFQASEDFLAKYGTHKLAPQMRVAQLQLAGTAMTPEADAILAKLAASDDTRLAGAAKQTIERKQKMAGLKTKPVELKFTATDGKELSLEALRGKVVLVDFWASWCGPCIGEMPNVVETYHKLHDKGFEIVGISLDQEKGAMEGALKKFGMTWRQYFDGKGWENEISSSFGITSIPAAWLIDKKGMLRETGLRGEALGKGVEKLLAE